MSQLDVQNPLAELAETTAVVTGGARGIGYAIAETLLRIQCTVVIVDRDREALDEGVAELAKIGAIVGVVANMSTDDGPLAIERALDSLPRLSVWVNNAGVVNHQAAEVSDPTTFERIMRDNAASVLRGAQAAFRCMQPNGRGSIVNIASLAVDKVQPNRLTYAATKSAVISMTRYMAQEWGPFGIRVNAVSPGYIETRLTTWAPDDPREIAKGETVATIAARRVGQPAEVASAVLFLASELASYVSGEILHVDGGWHLI